MFPMRKRKQQALKFEVLINVTSMTNLPKKYKHLRVMLTRGAKAVSTNELLAANQRVQPSATEGQMKMISTIYTGGEANRFEEKTYKLALARINPRAMREKEKKIGTTYINMAEYVGPDPVSAQVTLQMKVQEGSTPAEITLTIRSQWLRHLKGSSDADAMSDMTGMSMETSSVASGNTSLNSVPEEDEELLDMSSTSPRTLQHDSLKTGMVTDHLASTMPTRGHATAFEEGEGDTGFGRKEVAQASGSKAVFAAGGDRGEAGHEDVRAMRAMLQASAQETKQKLHDTEEKLAAKGEEAEGLRAQVARLEADLENAMRMQEELLQENEHAAAEFEKMLSQVHRSALRDHVDADQVDSLVAEVERLKTEALALTSERNDLRAKLARAPEAHHCDAPLAVADGAGNQAQQIAALEEALSRETSKADKFKSWLQQMTEQKASVESELKHVRDRLAAANVSNSKASPSRGVGAQEPTDKALLEMAAEMERISAQLVTASLGHAQAEQERLQARQQVYQLKQANRQLRERLTHLELQHAASLH